MRAIALDMALKDTWLSLGMRDPGAALRARRAGRVQQRLLAHVDHWLVQVDGALFDGSTGNRIALDHDRDLPRATCLAAAASELVGRSGASIGLLLPPAAFVATAYSLGISGEPLLRSSLQLQAHAIIPGYERPLLLALSGDAPAGVALWFPGDEADGLYEAFAQQQLELVAIAPRALAPAAGSAEPALSAIDEDSHGLTLVEHRAGRLVQWLHLQHRDLEDSAFAQQWQAALSRFAEPLPVRDRRFWTGWRAAGAPARSWCFFPAGALRQGRQWQARRQRVLGVVAGVALLVLTALPFISNALHIAWLNDQVAQLQDASREARRSQAAVYDMEARWGPVADYPQQDVAGIMLTLNQYIESSLLRFSLARGIVDIDGYTRDPALLVEQLAGEERFYGVGQSRSSSGGRNAETGNRFGIRMNLNDVDFPAWEARFDEQRAP